MPRGYGRGMGWWHDGRGMYWRGYPAYPMTANLPKDAVYVGPCRCGHGPHAHYRLASGEIVHAASLPYVTKAESVEPEPTQDELEQEIESLRNRVQELEKKLTESKGPAKR